MSCGYWGSIFSCRLRSENASCCRLDVDLVALHPLSSSFSDNFFANNKPALSRIYINPIELLYMVCLEFRGINLVT